MEKTVTVLIRKGIKNMMFFNLITLLGGLAMFLFGMRLMGDGLKASSTGALKRAMESVTNNPVKAFLLGIGVTAVIQSSTATIVITSGLVGAGVISLRQSLGIIIGANVGTTVTGQIIRLLDLNAASNIWLQLFRPSTLAPVALILGIVLIMGPRFKNHDTIGSIAMGFGILFSGLLSMTSAVSTLNETGIFETAFSRLGSNPFIGYATGATVAFILQSSSATIGILQAFSSTGQLTFQAIYAVLVGIYLGDCVTTAIVCSIGAKPEARRVGIVNILFNLSETVLVLLAVTVIHKLGLLDALWTRPINSGGIANTNTVFNLGCAVLLFPMLSTYERLSRRIVKDEPVPVNKYSDKLELLNPTFFSSPALAFNSCYDVLLTMFRAARTNIERALGQLFAYNPAAAAEIVEEEHNIDLLADRVSNYMVQLSSHVSRDDHVRIVDQYYKMVTEFERLGDHAENIGELAADLVAKGNPFSDAAISELDILADLIERILDYSEQAFERRDLEAARHIEPLEEVVDDMILSLREHHLGRLRDGLCNVYAGTDFLNLLSEMERISDVCSNIGLATIARAEPSVANLTHEFISNFRQSAEFNREYRAAREEYFSRLSALQELPADI